MRYFKGDYKYILAEAEYYETGIVSDGARLNFCSIDPDGSLAIQKGYAWDGASWFPDIRSIRRGSLIHDALYQLLRETSFSDVDAQAKREASDDVIRDVCLEDGMWGWLASLVYRGVRLGGGPSARVKKRKVYTAP